ncbi:MAG: TPM domain-containing protein [Gammaproteobacteria bacterium]|nr:TPM domain-containing protein [Gammaproteobacteria bacterium]MCW8986252.1 TPM domain-containing protein [Gammaproteobacteria bacterium]
MIFLTEINKQKISDAIKEAESKSDGEIVTVIAQQSDTYIYLPLLWASVIALSVPMLITLLSLTELTAYNYSIQLITFILLSLLFRFRPIQMRLIPKRVKNQRCHRMAMEQFFLNNIHHTDKRTGILIFVSVAEHYVEIIADKGINDVVEKDTWSGVVNNFIIKVKADQIADGFIEAITTCGNELVTHFPAGGKDINELPNHLIEIY